MNYFKGSFVLVMCFFLFGNTTKSQTPVRNELGYVLINAEGKILTETIYDFISKESSDCFIAVKDGLWGYLNSNGEVIIDLEYDVAYPFNGAFSLVGKNGSYFQINKANKILNTLDWAQAPVVYNEKYLIVNNKEIFYEDGELLLESQHYLINAPKSGIIEWTNSSDTIFQYTALHDQKKLFKAFNYTDLDTLFITQQGYFGLAKTEKFKKYYSIYTDKGEELIKIPGEGIYPNFIRVVWEEYVFWAQGSSFLPEHLYDEQEVHYPMKYLSLFQRNFRTDYGFQLSDKYFNDQMVLLPETRKWIQFDGRRVTGKYIFDDVLPGDDIYTPVKLETEWFILNRKQDTLGKTPFKYIHQSGMNNGRFFASTENPGSTGEKWAFVNLEEGIVTEEIYGIPVIPYTNNLESYMESLYRWHADLNIVQKDGKMTFINNLGEIIWTNPASDPIVPKDYFRIEFSINQGEYKSIPSKNDFKKNQLSVRIDPINNGINVAIANTASKAALVSVQDNQFNAKLEYKNSKGEWEVIAFIDPSTCGNSYYSIEFPAKKMTMSQINLPKGNTEMLVRVSLDVDHENRMFSNEIIIKTNGSRMRVAEYFTGYGLMYNQ